MRALDPRLARFLSMVAVPDNPDDCWLWMGKPGRAGYGHFCGHNPMCWSWEYFRRYPRGEYGSHRLNLRVLHRCDTPLCVNPEHLWLGTPYENTRDMLSKGRVRRVGGKLLVSAQALGIAPEEIDPDYLS